LEERKEEVVEGGDVARKEAMVGACVDCLAIALFATTISFKSRKIQIVSK
jgi:uncharacterized MnhB-related membrane protein